MATTFLIGCDPELFVKDNTGKLISAHGLISGDKKAPQKVDGGAVQVDGNALEFNTDPCNLNLRPGAFEIFNSRVTSVLKQMKSLCPEGYKFVIEPSVEFEKEYYDALPDAAKELGCDPDFNAWEGGAVNPRPERVGKTALLATAAGHIHFGWGEGIPIDHPDHIEICCDFVKTLDVALGIWSVLRDPDPRRRSMYGRAGAFRPKSYGVEYRVPSNFWIKEKQLRREMFYLCNQAILGMQGKIALKNWANYFSPAQIQNAINNSDEKDAKAIFALFFGNIENFEATTRGYL